MTPPPTPPDRHAIQSYFFDGDGREWIPTVLAPRGRELAAQWRGAYKVPDASRTSSKGAKKGSALPVVAAVLAILIVGGGAAVVAAQLGPDGGPAAKASDAPVAPAAPGALATPGAQATPAASGTAQPTAQTTQAPGQPTAALTSAATRAPTVAPRTPAPTAPPPAGGYVTLPDGTGVWYDGPARLDIGVKGRATFMVRAGNTPGTGTLLVTIGNLSTGTKTVSGTLDANGRMSVDIPASPIPGNFPITVVYKGMQAQVAVLRVG